MKCPKCQFDNPEGMQFCGKCGAKLERICPKCNFSNPAEFEFCGKCGHDLREVKAAPPIEYSQPQFYTPKFLVDKILTIRGSIEGERKLVTVLFADVANYTSISEKLDPEGVHQIMGGCFKILMDEIHKYEGTIDKFTGDGVMALFGAPVAHEDHAQRACHVALAIQRALREYGRKVKKEYGVDFKMRLGLNSGAVVLGAIGSDLRMDYTAIGETTNLASRIQSMARPGTILVSINTHKMAGEFFKFKPLGKMTVKGKREPLEVYELVEAGRIETRFQAAVAKGLTKFVGREKEITVLKEIFGKTQSGSGQVVGIVGEAGVGKSRLNLELREMLSREEYSYLEGRCFRYGDSVAYLPLLDLLRSYFDITVGEPESVIKRKMQEKIGQLDKNLESILPALQDIFSLKVEDERHLKLEPAMKREKTFEAIKDLLIRESQNRLLILGIEDLQWIDRTSEEFLTYLIGWLLSTRILLIIIYRPEYVHSWGNRSYYSQVGVNQLSAGEGANLVQSILQGEVTSEVIGLIIGKAGGNPLFIEELTYSLLGSSFIQKVDNQYELGGKASDIQVPDTIQGIIAARIDRLEDNLKKTLQLASVIGKDFSFRILEAVAGIPESLKSYLVNLQGLELVYERSLFPELEYSFKHALTQEVAYDSLLLRRRSEIHEKVAKAIEELYHDRLELFYEKLAYHYFRSQRTEKAYQYFVLSGNKAVRSYSGWEAFHFYKEAIKALNKLPRSQRNKRRGVEVCVLMEGPMRVLGFPEDSLQILQEGERLAKELGDERSLAILYGSIGSYYSMRGDPQVGRKYMENCLIAAQKAEYIELMAPIGLDLCTSYNISGEFSKIVDIVPNLIALIEKTQRTSELFGRPFNTNLYSALCAYWAIGTGMMGNFEEGEALCEKSLRFALDIKNSYNVGWAEFVYGWLLAERGDSEKSVEHCKESIKHITEAQFVLILGLAWCGLGHAYCLHGELESARQCVEKGLKIQRELGFGVLLSSYYYYLAMIHFDLGNLNSARNCIDQAINLAQNDNEKWREGTCTVYLGRILGKIEKPQYAQAEKCILEGIGILDELRIRPQISKGHLFLGELYVDAGQTEKALKELEKAQGMFQEMGMDYWLRRTQSILERF